MKKLFVTFLLCSLTLTTSLFAGSIVKRIICGPSIVYVGNTYNYMTLCTPDETFDWSVLGSGTLLTPSNHGIAKIRFNYSGTATIKCVAQNGEVMTKEVIVKVKSGGGGGNGPQFPVPITPYDPE
jgi:hypothetical protein